MRIPKTVKVGPHVYRIVKVSSSEMPEALGDSDFDLMRIRVLKNLRSSKGKEVLLHELLHCCTYPSFTGAYETDPKLDAEEFVNAVAPALLQLLRDNPDMVAYLSETKWQQT
jgi:hypothetical protein